jgi:hypothetical protein
MIALGCAGVVSMDVSTIAASSPPGQHHRESVLRAITPVPRSTPATTALPTPSAASTVAPSVSRTPAGGWPSHASTRAPRATTGRPKSAPRHPAPAAAHPVTGGLSATAFGMHWLNTANPYPSGTFGAARIWNMGVDWAQLQPSQSTRFDSSNGALVHLDQIVGTFRSRGVVPLLTLGMTPGWAADSCNHVADGVDWGVETCAPRDTSASGPWGAYVRAIAQRYQGKIRYFETWNEPSLRNGWNDSISKLAHMQAVAASILHSYGESLVSPSIPFTNGDASNGMHWLDSFFRAPGGKSFDIAGLHLYPNDDAVRGGYGPEWAVRVALADARSVLSRNGLSKPIWNTEMNIGRLPAHTGYGESAAGAAMVARTYLLELSAGVRRTFWYAVDDRQWGGTWLVRSDYRTLTPGGVAEKFLGHLIIGALTHGCSSSSVGSNAWRYTCRFTLANGRSMTAVWQTSGTWSYRTPSGTTGYYTVTGAAHAAGSGHVLTVGAAPVYVVS